MAGEVSASKEAIKFDDESPWPRRLLHVKTLTSYPWQPGNIYGGQKEPQYNAISYTWGRYRLKPGQELHVKPMPIEGTTWKDNLPRISPAHFSVDDMLSIFKTVAKSADMKSEVEFIWCDIACIDQTRNSIEGAIEVGRQARIFRGAKTVYAWITTMSLQGLNAWLTDLERLFMKMMTTPVDSLRAGEWAQWAEAMSRLYEDLFRDPWFTSLWTLQEAFLCPQLFLCPKSGLPMELDQDMGMLAEGLPHLSDMIDVWREVYSSRLLRLPEVAVAVPNFRTQIANLGLLQVAYEDRLISDRKYPPGSMGNPFSLLAASHARTTSREADRVYGIMQIFDLRLGKSAPGSEGKDFSLKELTDQLGTALVERYPIASQLITHETSQFGENWRIHTNIKQTQTGSHFWLHVAHGYDIYQPTKITTATKDGLLLALFQGPMAPISTFKTRAREHLPHLYFWIHLDRPWRLKLSQYLHRDLEDSLYSFWGDNTVEWLEKVFTDVVVLCLGATTDHERGRNPAGQIDDMKLVYGEMYFLVLQRVKGHENETPCYRRLGIMFRDCSSMSVVEGFEGIWEQTEGLFG